MKKTVHYDQSKGAFNIVMGSSAVVFPTDHPDSERVSNTTHVRTSAVVAIRANGEFETMNTVYVPKE
jgi:hypothetical protein